MQKKLLILILSLLSITSQSMLSSTASKKLWSILICTIEERKESFDRIYKKLQSQIHNNNLSDKIEILFFSDNRQNSIGFKRNTLIQQSTGEYVCFVDDDDDVNDRYVPMIYEKLVQKINGEKPDCVSLVGIITTNGKNPEKFIHSIQYNNKYCQENGIYYRPPNHLNPIKKSIAQQFLFPEKNFGEDMSWTLQIAHSGLLKTEAVIDEPYYFYQYNGKIRLIKTCINLGKNTDGAKYFLGAIGVFGFYTM